MSFFDSITSLPEDPILNLPNLYNKDCHQHKVNLGIGSYQDAEGKPLILACVKKAEAALLGKERSKEYLPIQGIGAYNDHVFKLIFNHSIEQHHLGYFLAQTLGGTGALRVGAEFLSQETSKKIYLPNPSWPNHKVVFSRGGMEINFYTYYDSGSHSVNFKGMCQDILKIPPGSTIMLHPCCHNPTGTDLQFEQWKELSQLIKKQKIIPFFDFAYQGFKDGVSEDARPIHYFVEQGHELLVANSFSKSFGLYGERVGALSVLTHHKEAAVKVGSQIKQIIRGNYSNPPTHGAKIVAHILGSEELKEEWLQELAMMRNRIKEMRYAFFIRLQKQIPDKDWAFVREQHGFFSYTGLSIEQTKQLIQNYGIYMPSDGRINIAGLNFHNIDYVVSSIGNVMRL